MDTMTNVTVTGLRISFAIVLSSAVWLIACNDGTEVMGVGGGNSKKKDGDIEIDDKASNMIGFDSPGSVEDNGDGTAIEYPNMDFLGRGVTTCKGENLPTRVQFFSKLYAEKLELNMYEASIKADKGKAEKEANQKISQNTGVTRFDRPTKAETTKFKEAGVKFASYAIYATKVTKERQGQTYEFDKPLPVFPWPAPASRYKELEKGPQSWTASVTGADSFTVTVTVSLVSLDGDEAQIKLETEIAEDQPENSDHRARYEAFPIPREATYTVNGKTRDVRMIENINWFRGDECKSRPEQISMTYNLCRKSTSEKDEQFTCE